MCKVDRGESHAPGCVWAETEVHLTPAFRRPQDAYTLTALQDLRNQAHGLGSPYFSIHTDEGTQPKENEMNEDLKAHRQTLLEDAEAAYAAALNRVHAAREKAAAAVTKGQAKVAAREAEVKEAAEAMDRARDALDRLNWPAEPEERPSVYARNGYHMGSGSTPRTVTFTRNLRGRAYSYAAVGVRSFREDRTLWYVTGNEGHRGQGMAWEDLLEWMGSHGRETLAVVRTVQKVAHR